MAELVADAVFSLFEQGDYASAARYFAPGAVIKQRFGRDAPSAPAVSYEEFKKAATGGPLAALGKPKYTERRVTVTADGGFVEQHNTTLQVAGEAVRLAAVCIATCDPTSGLITGLEEYLDPAPVAKAVGKGKEGGKPEGGASSPITAASTRGPAPVISTLTPDMVVVITGASGGIGEWLARVHAQEGGCKLVLAGRRAPELERVCAECRALSPSCEAVAVPTDVAKPEDCHALIRRAVESFGGGGGGGGGGGVIDRIYVNAGISMSATLEETDGPALLRRMLGVNLFGAADVVHAALPFLRGGSRPSRIGVISSALGRLVAPTQTAYAASKWAMHGFFESLRLELEPRGVTVTMVCPGPVNTSILGNLEGGSTTGSVGFTIDDEQRRKMMTAERAAALAVEAVENGTRCVVYGRALAGLVDLRSSDPVRVDAIMSQQYTALAAGAKPVQEDRGGGGGGRSRL